VFYRNITMEPRKGQPLVNVSFDEVLELCRELSYKIGETSQGKDFQLWGVPRNGLIIAGLMSHCGNFGIRKSPPFTPSFVENNTIVVDDIHDTGNTLTTYALRGMTTASLFWRKKCEFSNEWQKRFIPKCSGCCGSCQENHEADSNKQ